MDHFKKINRNLIKDIIDGKHSLAGNPSIPTDTLDKDEFLIKLFADRFNTVYNEGKRVVKKDDIESSDIITSSTVLVQLLNKIESQHKKKLEELAYEIIMKELDVDPEYVDLRVSLISDFVDLSHVRKQPTNRVKLQLNSKDDVTRIKNEVHKRRMINAIMQGASNSFNHIFHLFRDEFNAIDRRLVDGYQRVMSTAELAYFMMDLDNKQSGGFCSIKVPQNENEKFIVEVKGITFPLLVHEGIKGIMEVISMQGLPENQDEIKYVFEKADYYEAESWDMILGVGIWHKITDLMSNDAYDMKQHIFHDLVKLPVDEFHETMQEILMGTNKAQQIMNKMVKTIKNDLAEDEKLESLFRLEDIDDYTNLEDIDFDNI